jgi:hypothetical protein
MKMSMTSDIKEALNNVKIVRGLKGAIEAAVAKDAAQFFIAHTPIRTGNARSHTDLRGKTTIVADYPYAERLDEGYSPQAPAGMSRPTEDHIRTAAPDIAKQIINRGIQ